MNRLRIFVQGYKSVLQITVIFFCLFLSLSMNPVNKVQAGLPFRVNSITISCSPGTGSISTTKIEWFDYPSTTTGSVVSQSFKWENDVWVIKSSYYSSGGPSSSGVALRSSGASPGPGYFQGRGTTWLNGTWRVDLTSGTKYCS